MTYLYPCSIREIAATLDALSDAGHATTPAYDRLLARLLGAL